MATRKEIEETLAVTVAQGGTQLIILTPDLARLLRNAPDDNEVIAAMENDLGVYSERVDALENELTELRGNIPVAKKLSEEEKGQITFLEQVIKQLEAALAESEENCLGHIRRVEKRDKTIADYDAQVPGYLKGIEDQGAKIAELEGELIIQRDLVAEGDAKLAELESAV